MKKINSIGYAHRIIAAALAFLAAAALLLYLGKPSAVLLAMGWVFLVIGAAIAVFFIILLTIELHQDKQINKNYIHVKRGRVLLSGGKYECQNCGSRSVGITGEYCPSCGNRYKNGGNK